MGFNSAFKGLKVNRGAVMALVPKLVISYGK